MVAEEERLDGGRWRLGHLALGRHLEVVETLQSLLAERAQFRDRAEDAREEEQLLLRIAVVRAVVAQRVDETHLELLHLRRLLQAVALCNRQTRESVTRISLVYLFIILFLRNLCFVYCMVSLAII